MEEMKRLKKVRATVFTKSAMVASGKSRVPVVRADHRVRTELTHALSQEEKDKLNFHGHKSHWSMEKEPGKVSMSVSLSVPPPAEFSL